MPTRYILALDQGTTSSRALVFDQRGTVRATAQRELRQIYPHPGWVEHDAEEIWRSQLACARLAIARAGLKPQDIAAIGIANQRETTVLWDRASGKPVHHAIVWQDRRTAAHCDRLRRDGLADLIRAKTGLVLDPYFSATKIAWMLDSISGLRQRAERGDIAFGTIDTWLAWKLSGGALHVTDHSNASRTLLYDIHHGGWDEELLRIFKVPAAMLPKVLASSSLFGHTAQKLLGASIPIAGMAGDQQAALFGQTCHGPGMAKNTYGTGCFMLLHTGGDAIASKNGLITTVAASVGNSARAKTQFALEGSVFIGGAVVQWLRDELHLIKRSSDIEPLARKVRDSGGVYLVPAFTGLGAPHWDAYARGAIVGLTRGTSSAHLARAALESIAFQSAELLHAMQQDAGLRLAELRVDGGATENRLLMQFQADLLGIPVVSPRVRETTALGAAYLAGLACGVWASPKQIAKQWRVERRFEPRMSRDEAQSRMAQWGRALERAKGWAEPV
ncbi:MAG: glycerol kinase [Betaproteobacteria bacterium]|nr:glycerol kinase [Betaproteobacteria bacterium]